MKEHCFICESQIEEITDMVRVPASYHDNGIYRPSHKRHKDPFECILHLKERLEANTEAIEKLSK